MTSSVGKVMMGKIVWKESRGIKVVDTLVDT